MMIDMQIYFCWITVLLPEFQDQIIAGMAKRGYMVGPSSKDGRVISAPGDNPAGSVVALSVYKQIGSASAKEVYDDLVAILDESKGYFYSVIVAASTEAAWVGSNFQLPIKKQANLPPPIPPANPNRNLN
jgi:hypothetical protein